MTPRCLRFGHALVAMGCLLAVTPALAQSRNQARSPVRPPVLVRATVDAGLETFAASESFKAVFDSASAPVFGGGISVLTRPGLFADLRISRVRTSGQRVVVLDGTVYPLGVPNTLTVTPVEISAGFRWHRRNWKVNPYLGGGMGWHRVSEQATAGIGSDNAPRTFAGFQALGGMDLPLGRWLTAAGEVRWTSVPGALDHTNSVGTAFGESNLGGASVLARVIIGRH